MLQTRTLKDGVGMRLLWSVGPHTAGPHVGDLSGGALALLSLPPGVQVGPAAPELAVRDLDELGCLASGPHAVEGGAAHAYLVQDLGKLQTAVGHQLSSSGAGGLVVR